MTEPHYESSTLEPNEFSATDTLMSDELREDPMDAGYATPEGYRAVDEFGVTQAEQAEGETLDMRLAREEPDVAGPEVDEERVGRLVAPDGGRLEADAEPDEVARDVGWDGASTAEEAAMHVVTDEPVLSDEDALVAGAVDDDALPELHAGSEPAEDALGELDADAAGIDETELDERRELEAE